MRTLLIIRKLRICKTITQEMVEIFLVKWTMNYLYMIAYLEIILLFLLEHNIYLILWKNLTLLKSEASSGKTPRADLLSHPAWSFRSCSSSLFRYSLVGLRHSTSLNIFSCVVSLTYSWSIVKRSDWVIWLKTNLLSRNLHLE